MFRSITGHHQVSS